MQTFYCPVKKRINDIKKIRFIMAAPLEQKTERASLLLKVLDNISDEKERAVLMVQIMAINDRHYRRDDEDESVY